MPPPQARDTHEVMVALGLDGALLEFSASQRHVVSTSPSPRIVDWSAMFAAARLDMSHFTSTEPEYVDTTVADTRIAWQGEAGGSNSLLVRVEAGAFDGKPAYFHVVFPWSNTTRSVVPLDPFSERAWFLELLDLVLLIASAVLAYYNWTRNRGDLRGATIVGVYLFSAVVMAMVLGAHRVSAESILWSMLSVALSVSVTGALAYFGLEPWVRRMWPQALVTWSRVLAGRWRDPVVARDVAVGVLAAVAINSLRHALYFTMSPVGAPAATDALMGGLARFTLDQLMGTRFVAAAAFFCLGGGFRVALAMFFTFFLARALLRKPWLGAVVYLAFVSSYLLPLLIAGDWIELIVQLTVNIVTVLVMLRFGLLALAVWAQSAGSRSTPCSRMSSTPGTERVRSSWSL
jgi:hypothetical protein